MYVSANQQQVGIPVDHHLLHSVEAGGLAVAAVGTVAATVGELLAVRAIWKVTRDKKQQELDAAATAAVAALDAASGETARLEQQQQAQRLQQQQEEQVFVMLEEQQQLGQQHEEELRAQSAAADSSNGSINEAGDAGWRWDDGSSSSTNSSGPVCSTDSSDSVDGSKQG
jgi:hypothetical protein